MRVSAAQTALRLGDARFARDQLQIAARSRDRGRSDRRAAAWLATAHLRAAEGERGGAKRAAAAGLRILADHQQSLGATELRVGATAHAERLARLGLQLALEDRRPREVFRWAERVRANALATPTVRPPIDSPLSAALVELRRRRSDFDESRRAGAFDRRARGGCSASGVGGARPRPARRDRRDSDRARRLRGRRAGAARWRPPIGRVHRGRRDDPRGGRVGPALPPAHGARRGGRRERSRSIRSDSASVVSPVRRLSTASQAASLASLTDALAQARSCAPASAAPRRRRTRHRPDGCPAQPALGRPPVDHRPAALDRVERDEVDAAGRTCRSRPRVVVIAGPRLDDGPGRGRCGPLVVRPGEDPRRIGRHGRRRARSVGDGRHRPCRVPRTLPQRQPDVLVARTRRRAADGLRPRIRRIRTAYRRAPGMQRRRRRRQRRR